ncbi:hypothetical protein OLMES_2605 [Oleiphilus messinensis]|uniref:Uncharacterized protein n=1 Tax=Oleiphilus messinensis TaxID=141451 RepID=A0A1Y0IB09_9GAMM|nr:hypothetical protein OLMES_2605 [Oleiphilus messinensis]
MRKVNFTPASEYVIGNPMQRNAPNNRAQDQKSFLMTYSEKDVPKKRTNYKDRAVNFPQINGN